HEPVAENVDAHLSRGLVVAFPIMFGRVRLAEIHRPKWEHGVRPGLFLGTGAERQHQYPRASQSDSRHCPCGAGTHACRVPTHRDALRSPYGNFAARAVDNAIGSWPSATLAYPPT